MRIVILLVAASFLSGCREGPSGSHADPANYRQDCTCNEDCQAVYRKSCGGCNCGPAGAVRVEEAPRFEEQESRFECGDPPLLGEECSCLGFEVVCISGSCTTHTLDGTDGGGVVCGVRDAGCCELSTREYLPDGGCTIDAPICERLPPPAESGSLCGGSGMMTCWLESTDAGVRILTSGFGPPAHVPSSRGWTACDDATSSAAIGSPPCP